MFARGSKRKQNHKRFTFACSKSWIYCNRISSPYLVKFLRKDILYDLRLHRSWAYVDNAYLRVVCQLRPKRIKKTLEEKTVMWLHFKDQFLQSLLFWLLSYPAWEEGCLAQALIQNALQEKCQSDVLLWWHQHNNWSNALRTGNKLHTHACLQPRPVHICSDFPITGGWFQLTDCT